MMRNSAGYLDLSIEYPCRGPLHAPVHEEIWVGHRLVDDYVL